MTRDLWSLNYKPFYCLSNCVRKTKRAKRFTTTMRELRGKGEDGGRWIVIPVVRVVMVMPMAVTAVAIVVEKVRTKAKGGGGGHVASVNKILLKT